MSLRRWVPSRSMPILEVRTPEGKIFRHQIATDILRMGRSRRNDISLDDPSVSRVHAEIVRDAEGYHLHDLEGRSGTFVNDRRVSRSVQLHPGDIIRVGRTLVVFEPIQTGQVEFVATPLPGGSETTILAAADFAA